MKATNLIKELKAKASKKKAILLSGFFKTGKGHYGEGDKFLGITVPEQRIIAKKYIDISFEDLSNLVSSEWHEVRLTAFIILTLKFKKIKINSERKDIFDFYLKNVKYVNNWDLVDLTCHVIIGKFLLDKPRDLLYKLVCSHNLWEKRIAIVSCFAFIREKDFKDAIKISEILLLDKHDLIHKAVGWMLREIGKKDVDVLRSFLSKHYHEMPRTMLRYSIERLPEIERKKWLAK